MSHLVASSSTSRHSSLAPSAAPSFPLSSSKSLGVRAHLAEILPIPRHALFAVRLTIHQLWNVPLVSGEFSVKWKFQHAHKARIGANASNTSSRTTVTNWIRDDSIALPNGKGKGKKRAVVDQEQDPDHDSLMPSGASMLSVPSTSDSSPSPSPRSMSMDLPVNGNTKPNKNRNGCRGGSRVGGDEFSQDAHGRTPYVSLRDHHVKWGQMVNIAVQMGVLRDTMDLQPCELKLVVEQLSIPGDPDAPQNPRLGAVYLNLAEYVDEGPVTRRYLLRQSKTNATLQLTIDLTHIGGETVYKAPPLPKGEVMAGVATLLKKSAYSDFSQHSYGHAASQRSARGRRHAVDNGSRSEPLGAHTPIPELGNGKLRTTDNIIEAIFNPVPTSSPASSPFTYYVPPKPKPPAPLDLSETSGRADGPSSAVSGDASFSLSESRPPSIAPSALSARSQATTTSNSSAGEQPRQKWWQKLGTGRSHQPHTQRLEVASSPSSAQQSPRNASDASARSSSVAVGKHRFEDTGLGTDDRSAPQIVVLRPTAKVTPSIEPGS